MNRMANTVNPIERYVDSEAFEPYLDRIFLILKVLCDGCARKGGRGRG